MHQCDNIGQVGMHMGACTPVYLCIACMAGKMTTPEGLQKDLPLAIFLLLSVPFQGRQA